ncbi:MAG: hypothetical protein ACJ72M_12270 [Propionibacteriaceae bacterium]|jgi:hypothetical protein
MASRRRMGVSVAEHWLRDAAADGSLRHRLLDELCMSFESLVREAVSEGDIARALVDDVLVAVETLARLGDLIELEATVPHRTVNQTREVVEIRSD